MPEDDMMIRIVNVSKTFKGFHALSNININYEKGMIHGIIGRNGSGKTVLLKCILGLLTPSDGDVFVDGQKVGDCINSIVSTGAIIESPGFIPSYSGEDNLKLLAQISGIRYSADQMNSLFELVDLTSDKKKKVKAYSLGMVQRLGLAQALMNDPELLVLDEPMNSLDKKMVQKVKDILKQARNRGVTILFSSHIMDDINDLCDTVTEMDQGRVCSFNKYS